LIASAIRAIGASDTADVRDFLARKPYENVYLDWLLGQRRSLRDRLFCYRDADRTIRGVAFYGRQTVLAADSSEALDAFAEVAQNFPNERMIVAPRDVAHSFWERVQNWHRAPRLLRDRQPVFVLRSCPQVLRPRVSVRRAHLSEAAEVARNSAAMIEQELEYDPRRVAGDFFENIDHMIAEGLWWVGTLNRRLCFFCHVGPTSRLTVQLQGVWTPPSLRRHGVASDALGQICRHLLDEFPSISLYVNDFNSAAIALYRKIGFSEDGALATYLF